MALDEEKASVTDAPEHQKPDPNLHHRDTQPSSKELFRFLSKTNHDPAFAPELNMRFRAQLGLGEAEENLNAGVEGGTVGFQYKPDPFKHPPPPPVPPPPPPPPPPVFGPTSSFSQYKFGPATDGGGSFVEIWNSLFNKHHEELKRRDASMADEKKGSGDVEGMKENKLKQKSKGEEAKKSGDEMPSTTSFAEFWEDISGEEEKKPSQAQQEKVERAERPTTLPDGFNSEHPYFDPYLNKYYEQKQQK